MPGTTKSHASVLPGDALEELVDALSTALLARPVGERLGADALLAALRVAATGWDDARLAAFLAREEERLHQAFSKDRAAAGTHLLPAWLDHARTEVRRPVTLHAPLVLRLMDQPQVRRILAELMQVVVADFARKASSSLGENRLVGGVLGRARGMAGGLAGGLMSAVGEGLNAEAERRVRDFVDGAVGMALQQLVTQVCDPRRADAYGQLRAGIVQSAADTPTADWVAQVHALQPVEVLHGLFRAVRDSVHTPAFEAWFRDHHARISAHETRPLGDVLEEAGVLEPARAFLRHVLGDELGFAMGHPAMAAWWSRHGGGGAPERPRKARARTR